MAGSGASTKRVIDNAFDRSRASAAFGAAAETAVDLFWMTGKIFRGADGVADIVIAKDVTGTNNHKTEAPFADAAPSILKKMTGGKTKNGLFKQFQIERARTLESFQKGSHAVRNLRDFFASKIGRFRLPERMTRFQNAP